MRPRYDKGDWNAICDICGREFKASTLRKRWDNFMVCRDDWEPRQPQDFVRGVVDTQVPPWTRPENSDTFIPVDGPVQQAGTIGIGVIGSFIIGQALPVWWAPVPPSTFNEP